MKVSPIGQKWMMLLGAAIIAMLFYWAGGEEKPAVTIQVTLGKPSSAELAQVKAMDEKQDAYKKLEVKVRLDHVKKAVDRKIHIPELTLLLNEEDRIRVMSGRSFEQNNIGTESFAISEKSVVFDATDWEEEAIRRKLQTSYVTVSWTGRDGAARSDRFSIGNLLTVKREE